MLAIRMQRTGRSGHAMFRVIVQDSRRTPTSGKIVAQIGHYDPHSKTVSLLKDKAEFYLSHGAQPSPRVIGILKSEGVKLPKWVEQPTKKQGITRNPEKLRRNRPAESEAPATEPAAEAATDSEEILPTETETAPTEAVTPATEEAEEAVETPVTEEKPAAEESAASESQADEDSEASAEDSAPAADAK